MAKSSKIGVTLTRLLRSLKRIEDAIVAVQYVQYQCRYKFIEYRRIYVQITTYATCNLQSLGEILTNFPLCVLHVRRGHRHIQPVFITACQNSFLNSISLG